MNADDMLLKLTEETMADEGLVEEIADMMAVMRFEDGNTVARAIAEHLEEHYCYKYEEFGNWLDLAHEISFRI